MRFFTRFAGPVVIAAMIAAACAPEPSADASSASLTEAERATIAQTLLAWEDEWVAGFLSKDFAVLDRILAPDFIYTVGSGELHGKDSFIALLQSEPITFVRFDIVDVETRWYSDDVVVITGGPTTEGTDPDGNVVRGQARWTNVFQRRNGEWTCIVGHSNDVPA